MIGLGQFAKLPSIQEGLIGGGSTEDAFFGNIRLPNGTFKTTSAGRFCEADAWLLSHLEGNGPLRVLDVAVSSAVTSLELAAALKDGGFTPDMVCMDLFPTAHYRKVGALEVLSDHDFIYQVDLARWRFPNSMANNSGMVSAIYALARLLVRLTAAPEPLPFITAQARRQGMSVIRGDVIRGPLTQCGTGFALIRAMNILNLSYFSREDITQAANNLRAVLAPGGLFLVGRCDGSTTRASLMRQTSGTFEIVARLNGGADVEDIFVTA